MIETSTSGCLNFFSVMNTIQKLSKALKVFFFKYKSGTKHKYKRDHKHSMQREKEQIMTIIFVHKITRPYLRIITKS